MFSWTTIYAWLMSMMDIVVVFFRTMVRYSVATNLGTCTLGPVRHLGTHWKKNCEIAQISTTRPAATTNILIRKYQTMKQWSFPPG